MFHDVGYTFGVRGGWLAPCVQWQWDLIKPDIRTCMSWVLSATDCAPTTDDACAYAELKQVLAQAYRHDHDASGGPMDRSAARCTKRRRPQVGLVFTRCASFVSCSGEVS